jgi:fibro-slime domain-containing protein
MPKTLNRVFLNPSILLSAMIAAPLAVAGCAGGKPDAAAVDVAAGGSLVNAGGAGGGTTKTSDSTTPTGNGGAVPITIIVGSGGSSSRTTANTSAPKPAVCGDGVQDEGETCDDKNTSSDDGCSSDCKTVEDGFACPVPGQECVLLQVCGDKKISGNENCDDGENPPKSGDGCSENCHIEDGWACPRVGARCVADACGDGILAGNEACDDGNAKSGDGCSATCTVETPGPTERDGWVCPEVGKACKRSTCGNKQREGTEQCDDGNNDSGDGCTPACRLEPKCPAEGGACKSVCGDGVILPDDADQDCDDGNTTDGDGCSADCKVELGYRCSDAKVTPSGKLILPVVYRDFKGVVGRTFSTTSTDDGQHPDFELPTPLTDIEAGIVQPKLGPNGKPVHVATSKSTTINNDTAANGNDWFSLWYKDATGDVPQKGMPRFNYTFIDTLVLTELAASPGVFQFSSTSFFPLDDKSPSFGLTANQTHNFHFTSEVRYWFQYAGNELLQFKGDDDVWVFVNKQLAVDLGGIHSSISGSVKLDASNGTGSVCEKADPGCATPRVVSLGLELGKVYEIVVFQAERHTIYSNYQLTLSSFTSTRSVCSPYCGDGIQTPDEACDLGAENNTGDYNTCTPDCKLPPYCGDGNVDEGHEECDDAVNQGVYGFNDTRPCGPGCKKVHFCGDSHVDTVFGEQCDDGNRESGDGCEKNCTNRTGCGNGIREKDEECDDGNLVSGDKCSEFCTNEFSIQ